MPEMSDEARPDWLVRISIAVAGILGAGGIAAAAAGSHAGDAALLGPLSLIALTQAPAVLVLALLTRPRPLLKVGGLVIGAGALLFSADLAARHFFGTGPFPLSAPLGGSLMIIGWALVAVAGPFAPRR